jgi:tetratricopeptide (TPR) repeat protein
MDADEAGGLAREADGLRHYCELTQAERVARAGLRRFPDSADLHMALGRVLLVTHRFDAALMAFSQAAELAPEHDRPMGWQIATLSQQRLYQEAISLGNVALARFPDGAHVRIALGRVYLDSSRPQQAIRYLAEASVKAPGDETVSSWLAACRAAMFQWEEAEAIAREAIDWHPGSIKTRYRLGRILVDDHRHAEALACFEDGIALVPDHARTLEWRITALRALGRFEEAEKRAAEALVRFPKSPWLYVELGWVFCDQGNYERACVEVERALSLDGLNSWALRSRVDFLRMSRHFEAAEIAAHEGLKRTPRDPRLSTAAACVFADQEKHMRAVEIAEGALSFDPLNSWALRSRVDFLRRAYLLDEAERAAADAIMVRDDDPRIYTTAAWVSSSRGEFSKALARVDEALRLDPANCWALTSRIDFLRQAHRFREAEQAAECALRTRPEDPDIYLAAAWMYSSQDREDEAVERLAGALKIEGTNPAALTAELYFLRWARRFPQAEQSAAKALTAWPDDPDVLTAVGWVCSDRDKHDEAIRYAEKALAKDPGNSWALSCRINFLRAANRYDEAEQAAAEALRQRPDDPYLHTVVGFLHGDRNHYAKAIEHFDKALARNPWHLEALEWRSAALRSMLRFDEALSAAEAACALRPEDPLLRVELARVCDVRLDFDGTLRNLAEVLERDPGNVPAMIARSSAFRAVRNYEQADREISRLLLTMPDNRELRTELGWIKYDQRLADDARRVFSNLLDSGVNDAERAAAYYGLGWSHFAEGDFVSAAQPFREAVTRWPEDANYQLGLAWSLAGQRLSDRWEQAETIAYTVAGSRPDPFAHACLGLIAFKRGSFGAAEYHLKKTLELDKYQGSYTDLGALYVQVGRYAEAEGKLRHAVERDWYDAAAHAELGCLHLLRGDDHLQDAQHEFQQALGIDPASVRASVGLSEALSRQGKDADAETALRKALNQEGSGDRWRLYDALAWLLMRQGTRQQNTDLLEDADKEAQRAIGQGPNEAEPYFTAGLVQFRRASLTRYPLERRWSIRRARMYFNACLDRDKDNVDAKRYRDVLDRDLRWTASGTFGGVALAAVSLALLVSIWCVFLLTTKVSATLLSVNIPVLVGLFTISMLLPALTRLKMPGFEADLQPQSKQEPRGPTGEDSFGPGRLTVPSGPTGQMPRRGQARLQTAKSTKHV